ncbi:class F sortase [Plantactinospora sp. KBS50]|uniref:class F sortase n=1 Tax=Plantactinospora sp. KBS50 TaxID=2024580 RepID=UPI000BAAB047|nr:class F sortase [Plantactinospora sp. KBS50]ASW56405.1 hypothetical protein CIK06_22955 [Plantactinospora sp. KBS50]
MVRSPERASRFAGGRRGVPRRAAGIALLSLLVLMLIAGAGMVTAAFTVDSAAPPQPAAEFAPAPTAASTAQPSATAGRAATPAPPAVSLGRSTPTRLVIPKIKVDTKLLSLGVNKDDTIQVPDVRKQPKLAGWYKLGPSPGEIGNAVIVGHVDSKAVGPAVFFRLGSLKPGDQIKVTRADKKVVTFRVDAVGSYPKTAFPTDLVYSPSDQAGLRLVTCGGTFDRKKHSYQNNIVVLATAVSAK